MKSCPTCNRTFEDTLTYCLIDGSILSAPFDPHATLIIPEARQTVPPPTEVLRPQEEIKQELPPTIVSPQPERKPESLASTIAAPARAVESTQHAASAKQPARKSNSLAWFIIVLGSIFIIAFVFWVFTNKNKDTQTLPARKEVNLPRWVYVGVGDCGRRDTGSSDSSAEPVAGKCDSRSVGTIAVCWNGVDYRNGSDRRWCTYKNIPASSCTGGGAPGQIYECRNR